MNEVEDLKKEIVSLKIRLRIIEEFIRSMPSAEDYLQETEANDDPAFEEAVKIIQEHDLASASLLQRRLAIGYARAARLMDMLEKEGLVGKGEGAKPRKVLKK